MDANFTKSVEERPFNKYNFSCNVSEAGLELKHSILDSNRSIENMLISTEALAKMKMKRKECLITSKRK